MKSLIIFYPGLAIVTYGIWWMNKVFGETVWTVVINTVFYVGVVYISSILTVNMAKH